jgi:hypothetical protein
MRRTAWAALPVLAALALAGCGTAASTSSSPAASTATAATAEPSGTVLSPANPVTNPVTIVRETGATPAPGEVYGSTTADGWLSADGSFSSGGQSYGNYERITLYTLPAGLTGQQAIAQVGVTSSDSQVLVAGGSFYMFVYPAQNPQTDVTTYPVPPAVIAARVHGTVIEPSS